MAYVVCLLLPMAAVAGSDLGPTGSSESMGSSRHTWPTTAVTVQQVNSPAPTVSTDQAVQTLQRTGAQPTTTPAESLIHIDLNSRVRLAMVTRPREYVSRLGASGFCVSLFALRW